MLSAPTTNLVTQADLPALVSTLVDASSAGCGCSYEVFVSKFSAAVDNSIDSLPEELRNEFISLARPHGYMTRSELAKAEKEMADDGVCVHGLDYMTCPCGCFED